MVLLTPTDIAINIRGHPIHVVCQATGRITRVLAHEGSNVRIGDTLIQLDTRDLLLQLRSIETRIHFAEFDANPAGLAALYEQLEKMKVMIGQFTITSPIEGRIRFVKRLYEGEMLMEGELVVVVTPEGV